MVIQNLQPVFKHEENSNVLDGCIQEMGIESLSVFISNLKRQENIRTHVCLCVDMAMVLHELKLNNQIE